MSTQRVPPLARSLASLSLAAGLVLFGGCDEGQQEDDHHGDNHETEVLTTVRLTFTPQGGGDQATATFIDPDGDGGMSGSAESIVLAVDVTYDLQLEFFNELEDPVEDVTLEIEEEAEEHLTLIGGSAVEGPATAANPDALVVHAYADTEQDYGPNAVDEDLPVGLVNTITTQTMGSGTFTVMLRHLPELNGLPQKRADLPSVWASGEALPGEVDVDVEFQLRVQ
ncbi:MAG: hypothetical protein K0V04_06515 [Deltaproteobacteria bacterium]|nr:hypothetical protein [Deltaproteobacteria bacterium]